MTSLEHCGGSGVSESCSKEFLTKRSEIGGVPSIAGSETKTLPELEAMHQSLLEHRKFLLKKMEAKRRSKVALVAKDRELKELKMVVVGEREVLRIPDSKPIRRFLAKKKSALPELEAMHQSLLEHRKFLLKKMEGKRRSKVVLVAKNRELKELKMRLKSRKRPNTAPLPEEELPKQVRLPDLNVPFVPESD